MADKKQAEQTNGPVAVTQTKSSKKNGGNQTPTLTTANLDDVPAIAASLLSPTANKPQGSPKGQGAKSPQRAQSPAKGKAKSQANDEDEDEEEDSESGKKKTVLPKPKGKKANAKANEEKSKSSGSNAPKKVDMAEYYAKKRAAKNLPSAKSPRSSNREQEQSAAEKDAQERDESGSNSTENWLNFPQELMPYFSKVAGYVKKDASYTVEETYQMWVKAARELKAHEEKEHHSGRHESGHHTHRNEPSVPHTTTQMSPSPSTFVATSPFGNLSFHPQVQQPQQTQQPSFGSYVPSPTPIQTQTPQVNQQTHTSS